MKVVYKNCDCKFWDEGLTQSSIFSILGTHFTYCPWCGKLLKESFVTTLEHKGDVYWVHSIASTLEAE